MVERIYVAGPYTAPSRQEVEENIRIAVHAARECMLRGHDVLCPHAASDPIEMVSPGVIPYARWMRLDFGLIEHWATVLLYLRPSPGANQELLLAEHCRLRIYRSVEEVPWA